MKLSLSISRDKPAAKGTVVATTNLRTGWEAFGIPADAGDGFAYNAEGRLWGENVVSERTMLQLDTVMACVRLLSQTIATLPIGIFRRLGDGGRKVMPDHQLYELLHNQPNADMTAVDFWQVMIAMMLLRGNGFAEIDRIGDRIVAITPLAAGCVTWRRLPNSGELEFTYTFNGRQRVIPRRDLWILPAFTMDGVLGLSPVCYGANVFSGAMAADRASNQTFSNGMAASGFVSYGKDSNAWLTETQRKQLKGSIGEFSRGGSSRGGVFVLEGGMGYTALSMNPEDAQMLETRAFNVEAICRWFGVPPTLVGHGDKTSNWGTGLEQQNLSFLTYSLRPWLAKIEQSVRKNLLSPAEKARYFAEFSVEGLLRADSAGRAAFYSIMVNNGIWARDEVRLKENMEPRGGNAAVLTVQSALVPLDKLGEKPPAAPPAVPAPAEDPTP
jgi:HK97 family phage portal protein